MSSSPGVLLVFSRPDPARAAPWKVRLTARGARWVESRGRRRRTREEWEDEQQHCHERGARTRARHRCHGASKRLT